jgi:hypothetical protein
MLKSLGWSRTSSKVSYCVIVKNNYQKPSPQTQFHEQIAERSVDVYWVFGAIQQRILSVFN